jgi:hypothetical protein
VIREVEVSMMTKTQGRAGIMPASPVLQQIQIVSKQGRTDARNPRCYACTERLLCLFCQAVFPTLEA